MKRLKVLSAIAVMALLLAACGGSKTEETTAAPAATEETIKEAATESEEETAPAAEQDDSSAAEECQMLQGVVQDVSEDGDSFSLLCDDGVTRKISVYDIGDMEVDPEDGLQIAIACIGKITDDLSGVTLVVALPEQEEWTIQTKTGVTTNNAMSAFGIETDDGENIQLLKDNCPIEDNALSQDEGDRITVTYVIASYGNFPFVIKPAD